MKGTGVDFFFINSTPAPLIPSLATGLKVSELISFLIIRLRYLGYDALIASLFERLKGTGIDFFFGKSTSPPLIPWTYV